MAQENQRGPNYNDVLNKAYGGYQNGKFVLSLAKLAFRLLPLAGSGIIIFLVVTTIIMVFVFGIGAAASTPGGFNNQSGSTIQNINGLFNFDSATTDEQNAIYGFFQATSNYSMYQKLLTVGGPVNISFGTDPALRPGWCGGSVSNGDITFYNYLSCGVGGQKYLFFHESGHTIANRNPDIYNLYASSYSGLVAQDGAQCYTGGFLNSYVKEFGGVAGPINESFAESVAVSLLKSWGTFNDFPSDCPATYNWFSKYVLGL